MDCFLHLSPGCIPKISPVKHNKKAPAMHRSEDDYLLTTRLFCGKCGAMMVGEIGTSHTQSKYRYYKCNQAKKHKCDKKAVKRLDRRFGYRRNTFPDFQR